MSNKKTARGQGGYLHFLRCVLFLHSHRCHPNRNWVLKNKDHNNDDNKGEAED